jgi:hypothetical protein
MATLVHEIWETIDDRGGVLPSLGLAGPDGDDLRKRLRERMHTKTVSPIPKNGHDGSPERIKNTFTSL